MITGEEGTMILPMTVEEFDAALELWQKGTLIQSAFHMLNANQREFIMTGILPVDWDIMMQLEG